MNNKGFTLVEIIAVVTILALLAVITTPAYDKVSKNIKMRNYISKKETIKAQTLSYVEKYFKNETYDPGNGGKKTLCFSVQYLIQNGIISSDDEKEEYIEDNTTGTHYSGDQIFVKISYDIDKRKIFALAPGDDEYITSLNGTETNYTFDNMICSNENFK